MRHRDLHLYLAATRQKKYELCAVLGVSRFQLSGLLYPDRYPVVLTDDLVERVARLLNQTPEYVRRLYSKAA